MTKPKEQRAEERVLKAAMRLYAKLPIDFGHLSIFYGPAHQTFWKACKALSKSRVPTGRRRK